MAGALAAAPGTSLASTWVAERRGLVQLQPHLSGVGMPGWEMGSERREGLAEAAVPLETGAHGSTPSSLIAFSAQSCQP